MLGDQRHRNAVENLRRMPGSLMRHCAECCVARKTRSATKKVFWSNKKHHRLRTERWGTMLTDSNREMSLPLTRTNKDLRKDVLSFQFYWFSYLPSNPQDFTCSGLLRPLIGLGIAERSDDVVHIGYDSFIGFIVYCWVIGARSTGLQRWCILSARALGLSRLADARPANENFLPIFAHSFIRTSSVRCLASGRAV